MTTQTFMDSHYSLSITGLPKPEGFQKHVEQAVADIVRVVGSDCDIRIWARALPTIQRRFLLRAVVYANGKVFRTEKSGRRLIGLLKQTKKVILRFFRDDSGNDNPQRPTPPHKIIHLPVGYPPDLSHQVS